MLATTISISSPSQPISLQMWRLQLPSSNALHWIELCCIDDAQVQCDATYCSTSIQCELWCNALWFCKSLTDWLHSFLHRSLQMTDRSPNSLLLLPPASPLFQRCTILLLFPLWVIQICHHHPTICFFSLLLITFFLALSSFPTTKNRLMAAVGSDKWIRGKW